jgi:predicted RNase H-like nuclease (RuvC/YqgF family)
MGSGYLKKCPKCNDTRKIKCKECNGSGKVESEWYKSLRNMPVERLRFEYEKRQREIQSLEIQMDRLSREYEDAYQVHMDLPIGYGSSRLDSLERQMSGQRSYLMKLENEISIIEQVINLKWK